MRASLVSVLLFAGCACGLDAGKIDDLRCNGDSDCLPEQDCIDGFCVRRECESDADCRPPSVCRGDYCGPEVCEAGHDCDDDDPCTQNDTCRSGVCVGDGYSCDDDRDCTDDVCDGEGGCTNPLRAGHCLIDGECHRAGDANPANGCEECDPGESESDWHVDDTNEPDDGMECTIDSCSGGVPVHVPDDGRCSGGDVCAACAGTADGCVGTPTPTLACDDRVSPGAPGAACTVTLADAGQAACLDCTSLVGMTSLILERFDDCPDLADAGWTVVGSPVCPVDAAVAPDPLVAEDALEADGDTWTIERFVNTTDFDEVRLCFDYADEGADGSSILEVFVEAGGGWASVYRDDRGPIEQVENTWFTVCLDLDDEVGAAADNPNLGVRFVATAGGGHEIYLDNVALDAWDSAYLSFLPALVEDAFTGCDLGGWAAAGDPVACPPTEGAFDGIDALQAKDARWTLTRDVDASNVCDDLWVSFRYGAKGTGDDDFLTLLYDGGAGFAPVWANYRRAADDDLFAPIEVSISHVDPDVRFDPALGIRFAMTHVGGGGLVLDDVSVTGASCGSGDALLGFAAPEDAGGGAYSFDVESPVQATTYVGCSWDGRPVLSNREQVVFVR